MGCIESRDAGLVAFPFRLRPLCRHTYSSGRSGAKRRKGLGDDDTAEIVLPSPLLFSLTLHPVRVVAFRVMDETRSLFPLVRPRLGMREKRYRYHVHIPNTCPSFRSICVSRMRDEREEGVFIRRDAIALCGFSLFLLSYHTRRRRIRVDSTSFDARFNRERPIVIPVYRPNLIASTLLH